MSGAKPNRRIALLAVGVGLSAFCVSALIGEPTLRAFFRPDFLREWIRVGRVMRLTQSRFVDEAKVGFAQLGRNAALGAASGLDRYTEYLDEPAYAEQNRRAEQLFTGVGILMQPVDGLITVERVYAGGGAEAAGILPGDRIVAADSHDLVGLPLPEAGARIKGAEGTVVNLRVLRPGDPAPRNIAVTRRTVTVPTVSSSRLMEDGATAYVAVDRFERRTPRELADAYEALRAKGANRLILDLRANPGGLVDAAADTVGLFTPEGSVVARLAGRTSGESETFRTRTAPAYPDTPVVILVDGNSASASEIVAGALQDYRRAVLVGAQTFGKGLVQSIYRLDDTTGLKLTTARYTLPGGRSIHGTGIAPDVPVPEQSGAAGRRFAEEALLAQSGGPDTFEARFGYRPEGDRVLAAALRLISASRAR